MDHQTPRDILSVKFPWTRASVSGREGGFEIGPKSMQGRERGVFQETLAACGCLREAFSPSPNRKVSGRGSALQSGNLTRAEHTKFPLHKHIYQLWRACGFITLQQRTKHCYAMSLISREPPMCSSKLFKAWTQISTGNPCQ